MEIEEDNQSFRRHRGEMGRNGRQWLISARESYEAKRCQTAWKIERNFIDKVSQITSFVVWEVNKSLEEFLTNDNKGNSKTNLFSIVFNSIVHKRARYSYVFKLSIVVRCLCAFSWPYIENVGPSTFYKLLFNMICMSIRIIRSKAFTRF